MRVEAGGLTAGRLQQLRSALAAFADDPPVTLERYLLPAGTIAGGHAVAQGAPILQHLVQIIGTKAAAAAGPSAGGETLYRMVVDQRVAGQLAQGLARPMEAAGGGIYSAVLGKGGIVANARFVPAAAAGGGGAGLAAAGGGAAIGLGGAVVTAAPFVVLAIAAAGAIYAEEQGAAPWSASRAA